MTIVSHSFQRLHVAFGWTVPSKVRGQQHMCHRRWKFLLQVSYCLIASESDFSEVLPVGVTQWHIPWLLLPDTRSPKSRAGARPTKHFVRSIDVKTACKRQKQKKPKCDWWTDRPIDIVGFWVACSRLKIPNHTYRRSNSSEWWIGWKCSRVL